jgi:hypothetical protein
MFFFFFFMMFEIYSLMLGEFSPISVSGGYSFVLTEQPYLDNKVYLAVIPS